MTKKEVKAVIDAEIEWRRETPMNMSEDFRKGFIQGLRQAKVLISKIRTTNGS